MEIKSSPGADLRSLSNRFYGQIGMQTKQKGNPSSSIINEMLEI